MSDRDPRFTYPSRVGTPDPPGEPGRRRLAGLNKNLRMAEKDQQSAKESANKITSGILKQPTNSMPSRPSHESSMSGAPQGPNTRSQNSSDNIVRPKKSDSASTAQNPDNHVLVDESNSHPGPNRSAKSIFKGMSAPDIVDLIKETGIAGTFTKKSNTSVLLRFNDTETALDATLMDYTEFKKPLLLKTGTQHDTVLGALQNLLLEYVKAYNFNFGKQVFDPHVVSR